MSYSISLTYSHTPNLEMLSHLKRKSEKYLIKHINTERYMKSSIPAMQRLLNLEELKMTSLLNSINSGTREHCYYNPISVKI